jgi:hypothetical protein
MPAAPVGVKVDFVLFIPVDPSTVPNGTFFLDSTNGNAPTVKGTGGSALAVPAFKDQQYLAVDPGQSDFVVTVAAFTAGSLLDVYVGGRLLTEGADADYTRDVGTQTIHLITAVSFGTSVRVRVYA